MERGTKRILALWVGLSLTVLGVSMIIALVVRFKEFSGCTLLLGTGDQIPMIAGHAHGQSFSRYFCEELIVKVASIDNSEDVASHGPIFNAYVLSEMPSLSGKSYRQVLNGTTMIGAARATPPMVFHYHREDKSVSWMKVHACSESTNIALYRCDDQHAAIAWQLNGNNQRCTKLCDYAQCGAADKAKYCMFVAHSDTQVDEFVLILATQVDSADKTVHIRANLTRYPYELDHHSYACFNHSNCTLPIFPRETHAVVIESAVTRSSAISPMVIETRCVPRISIYIALFLGFPLVAIAVVFICVCLPCIFMQKSRQRDRIELRVQDFSKEGASDQVVRADDSAELVPNEVLREEVPCST